MVVPKPYNQWRGAHLRFCGRQPDTSQTCITVNTGPVRHTVCLFTSQACADYRIIGLLFGDGEVYTQQRSGCDSNPGPVDRARDTITAAAAADSGRDVNATKKNHAKLSDRVKDTLHVFELIGGKQHRLSHHRLANCRPLNRRHIFTLVPATLRPECDTVLRCYSHKRPGATA